MQQVKMFKTGVEELDNKALKKEEGIGSDEIVEICGCSGTGKTYLCLKMASLALLDQNISVYYIDTTNYVNSENTKMFLRNFIPDQGPERDKRA